MKIFRLLILLFASLLQTKLTLINFYLYQTNDIIGFVKSPFFAILMIVCAFIFLLVLKKLIAKSFFFFFDEDVENSASIMENCIAESFIILICYNVFCLILNYYHPDKYTLFILGTYSTGKGAMNFIFLFFISFIQSIYINLSYMIKLKKILILTAFLKRQILITILMAIPYVKNIYTYFGRL